MKHLILFVVVLATASARFMIPTGIHPLSQKMIDYINYMNTTWKVSYLKYRFADFATFNFKSCFYILLCTVTVYWNY